jgi:hypothetical protein
VGGGFGLCRGAPRWSCASRCMDPGSEPVYAAAATPPTVRAPSAAAAATPWLTRELITGRRRRRTCRACRGPVLAGRVAIYAATARGSPDSSWTEDGADAAASSFARACSSDDAPTDGSWPRKSRSAATSSKGEVLRGCQVRRVMSLGEATATPNALHPPVTRCP